MPFTYVVEEALDERLHLLAVGLGEGGLRELVRGVLVLADPLELRLDAELVEGALEERHLGGEARDVEESGRRGGDLRAARGEVVLGVARGLEVGPGGLAAAAEPHERVAQVLDARPAGVDRAHAKHEPAHGRVPRRAVDRVDEASDRGRARLEERREPAGRLLRHLARDVQREVLVAARPAHRRPSATADHESNRADRRRAERDGGDAGGEHPGGALGHDSAVSSGRPTGGSRPCGVPRLRRRSPGTPRRPAGRPRAPRPSASRPRASGPRS